MKQGKHRRIAALLGDALSAAFQKPATVDYPQGEPHIPTASRGLLTYQKDGCIGCGLCMRDCPTGAISVKNHGTKDEKDMRAELDTGRCIYCGQCADTCPKKCLHCSSDVLLAKRSRNGLRVQL